MVLELEDPIDKLKAGALNPPRSGFGQGERAMPQVQLPELGVYCSAVSAMARRLAPAGLSVILVSAEGEVILSAGSEAPFFARYAAPLLRRQAQWMADGTACLTAQGEVRSMETFDDATTAAAAAGLSVAAFSLKMSRGWSGVSAPLPTARRRAGEEKPKAGCGLVVVAGRSADFELTEEVLRECSRLGVDGQWLQQAARSVPGHDSEQMARWGQLLYAGVEDQLRLAGLEEELGSLSQQLANTYEELSLVYQISGGMKINRGAGAFFEQACRDVLEVMAVRGIGVMLPRRQKGEERLALYGQVALPPEALERAAGLIMAQLMGQASRPDGEGSGLRYQNPSGMLLIEDVCADPIFAWLGGQVRQLLAVPMQRQDQVLGCLFALDKTSGAFDSVDAKLLHSIANESAIYLENAMLFEDVHGLMMGLLHSLTSAVDAKDAYTCGHSGRVALLSRALAVELGLSAPQVERIYMAGLLHDVGKIGVPESVLQKTGRLTPEEFDQIKKHPQIGARILRDIRQIEDIIPGVLHHHERYDGKGYPSGLAGSEIPEMGRIICLADCLDAMTSNRTYRNALPLEVALNEIRRCAGTQFDPGLADAFLGMGVDRFRQILLNHQQRSNLLLDLQEAMRRE
jgi:putative nucleotidyltransferase with HDIG domain